MPSAIRLLEVRGIKSCPTMEEVPFKCPRCSINTAVTVTSTIGTTTLISKTGIMNLGRTKNEAALKAVRSTLPITRATRYPIAMESKTGRALIMVPLRNLVAKITPKPKVIRANKGFVVASPQATGARSKPIAMTTMAKMTGGIIILIQRQPISLTKSPTTIVVNPAAIMPPPTMP